MYKSNQKAYALVIVFILIASLFLVPASAETVEGQYYNGIKVTALTVNLIRSDGTVVEVTPTVIYNNSLEAVGSGDAPGYYVEFQNPNGLMTLNEYYTIVLHLTTESYLQPTDKYVIGGYDVLTDWTYENVGYYSASRTGGGHTQKTTPTVANAYGFNGINVNYEPGTLGLFYSSYVCSFRVKCLKSANYFVLYIKNIDLKVISSEELAAQSIIDNQDKNTQAIIDNEKDLYEQEKNEITQSGNQAADAKDNVPDKSEGFVAALKLFVDTMSTNSTECNITFPEIKIPAVPSLWEEKVLSEEKEVDISGAIQLIPKTIMDLIQAVTTLGLLIYCFKELYDTISEALTRKKASSDG